MAVILPILVFLLSCLSIAALIVIAGGASRWSGRMFQFLMLMTVSASIGSVLLSERILIFGDQGLMVASEGDGGGFIAKILLVGVIGFSFSLCCAWVFIVKFYKGKDCRFINRFYVPPSDLVYSFVVFYISFSILPLVFGQQYYFHVSLIYPFFVFSALFLWVQLSNVDPVITVKQCLSVIVIGSLGAAVVLPQLALQPGYTGLVPGFNLRLWGITASANTLGSVASVLIVLEAAEPSKRAWLRYIVLLASAICLLLTQSKTSIFAAILGLSILYAWRILNDNHQRKLAKPNSGAFLAITIVSVLSVVIGVACFWVLFSDTSILSAIERKLASRAVGDITSATGRTWIWVVAIEGGLENPLFGQGADFWGLGNRLRLGLSGAVHAHNQFLQIFSRSGFIGLGTFLIFLWYLVQYSLRAANPTRGGAIALLVVFFIRAIFEVPLQVNSILGGEFFAMMAFIVYVLDRGGKKIGIPRNKFDRSSNVTSGGVII